MTTATVKTVTLTVDCAGIEVDIPIPRDKADKLTKGASGTLDALASKVLASANGTPKTAVEPSKKAAGKKTKETEEDEAEEEAEEESEEEAEEESEEETEEETEDDEGFDVEPLKKKLIKAGLVRDVVNILKNGGAPTDDIPDLCVQIVEETDYEIPAFEGIAIKKLRGLVAAAIEEMGGDDGEEEEEEEEKPTKKSTKKPIKKK